MPLIPRSGPELPAVPRAREPVRAIAGDPNFAGGDKDRGPGEVVDVLEEEQANPRDSPGLAVPPESVGELDRESAGTYPLG